MSSKYRIDYHLKRHRKDEFIDWIKGMLSIPFCLLHSYNLEDVMNATNELETDLKGDKITEEAFQRYLAIFQDIESLVQEKIKDNNDGKSRLDQLVPSIGPIFTPLPLARAFAIQSDKRRISARRFVSVSFNDVRHILNTAQVLHFTDPNVSKLKLVTFDGDVTLYEDGGSLTNDNKIILPMLEILSHGVKVGLVTAAGYDTPEMYETRLSGIVEALYMREDIPYNYKQNLVIMGGESNYLFQYYEDKHLEKRGFLKVEPHQSWMLPEMVEWDDNDIKAVLDLAERILHKLKKKLNLSPETQIIRKKRACGIMPGHKVDEKTAENIKPLKFTRENLEEMVLTLQKIMENYPPAQRIQFSCFDGGSDCWCDIGGKDLGVRALQYFWDKENPIKPTETLHIGDQFAPMVGCNDFKSRLSGCTLWIASPEETNELLMDILQRWQK